MSMSVVFLIGKICVLAFFGIIFLWNMIDLLRTKARNELSSELYFEKQMWMVVSLLAIAIVLGNL